MDNQSLSSQNRTAGCENPGVVSGGGGRTPPKPSGGENQGLNAAGGTSRFPPTFSGDEPRPLETDFFRYASLFFAHLGPEEESEQWASYLPENLRPGNIDKYLEETDSPDLYGNKYWWLSQEDSAQEQPSFDQSYDRIRHSRVHLLELREVMTIPENILKIKEEIEAEYLGVNQITRCGGTKVASISVNSMKDAPQSGEKENHEVENISLNLMKVSLEIREKEEHEVANISANSTKEAPQTGEKEKHEVENVSVNPMRESPQTGDKEKHEDSCYNANLQMRNVNLNEHRKKVGQLDSGPAEEQPKAKDCHLVYKRSRKKNMVANISTNSMQEGPQKGEKEKQEGSVSESKKEKKKRRVLSKERKEKRRIAKKKKRAEKNRKLGVKRLKIQPLLKPKPVSHCRHYLKGRCHEGEKCKFSHDVQPLTKSLPCCHFARQSCMKGDDCPYDHDLSKYPCNKYVSTGFCPRQENCLFSHKVTPNQDPAPTKAETKALNPPPASDSIERHSQKPHFVFGAENSRVNVSASKADQPMREPQGLSFLNSGNPQKDKQPVPTSTSAHVIVSGKKTAFGGDPKGPALPSYPPTLPNPAGVFVFGKNPPHDHNPPASPNSGGVFVFGKNPPPDQDPAPTTSTTKPETKASNPPRASDSIQHHSQKPHFVFGARNQQAEISTMAENSRANVSASKADQPVRELQGLSFLNNGNSQKDKQSSTSADVIVSGKKTVFGGFPRGPALPSNPPTLPNPAGVFVFGKNPPHDHNPPASPNSGGVFVFGKNPPPDQNPPASPNCAGVFVFGKNPLPNRNPPALPNSAGVFVFGKNPPPDHNKRNQPSLLPLGNNNKTRFGGGKKGSATPSNSTTSAFSARLSGLMKKTSSSGHRSSLSTSASGSNPVNKNQGTSPVSGFESGVNVHSSSGGTNSASADASKKPLSAVEVWETLYGRDQPTSAPSTSSSSGKSSFLSTWASGSSPVSRSGLFESGANVHTSAGTNSSSADASKKLSAVEAWEMLYGRDQPTNASSTSSSRQSSFLSAWASGSSPVIGLFESGVNVHASSAGTSPSSADASKKLTAVEAWEALFGKKIL